MPRPRPPHLHREKTRHGAFVWYVRRDHGARLRLWAEYGTAEFWSEYRAALEWVPSPSKGSKAKPLSLEDVRAAPALIGFSESIRKEQLELKRFLNDKLYRHYRVARMSRKARNVVADLFGAFLAEPRILPPEFQVRAGDDKARAIADYIAGMTDRYAMLEHRRLFSIEAI